MKNYQETNYQSFASSEAVRAYADARYLRTSEAEVMERYMPAGARVLDIGCGAGRTTGFIAAHGCTVIGIDISAALIHEAKRAYPAIEFRIMDAMQLEYPDNYFDTVFFSFNGLDNLSPLENRWKAIQEMKRVVKTGGYVIYSSHNSFCIPRTLTGWKILLANVHRFRLGPQWRRENHGFGDLVQYYNNVWNERRQLHKFGLTVIDILGNGRIGKLPLFEKGFLEKFPMYVTRK